MPIYAYRCDTCGFAKDVLQKVSDPLLTACPSCGAETFRKQVTAAGFQLKGSGWYATDFKGGNTSVPPVKNGAESGDAKPAASDGDAKPAASDAGSTPSAPVAAPPPAAASGSGASK